MVMVDCVVPPGAGVIEFVLKTTEAPTGTPEVEMVTGDEKVPRDCTVTITLPCEL